MNDPAIVTPPETLNETPRDANHLENRTPGQARQVRFEELAGGEKEIVIEYRGQFYRLRATRNGKLILNK